MNSTNNNNNNLSCGLSESAFRFVLPSDLCRVLYGSSASKTDTRSHAHSQATTMPPPQPAASQANQQSQYPIVGPLPYRLHLRRLPTGNKLKGDTSSNNPDTLVLLDHFTKFGRNPDKCDVVLTSTISNSSNMISRDHAEINGEKGASGQLERYFIDDRSLNGTYINDHRLNGKTEIRSGDVIKFGHMNGAAVKKGELAPQANAEFAFMVELALEGVRYIGFDNHYRRIKPIVCSGDSLHCTEMEGRSIDRDKAPLSAGLSMPAPQAGYNAAMGGGVIGVAPSAAHHSSQMHSSNSAATSVAAHFAQGQHVQSQLHTSPSAASSAQQAAAAAAASLASMPPISGSANDSTMATMGWLNTIAQFPMAFQSQLQYLQNPAAQLQWMQQNAALQAARQPQTSQFRMPDVLSAAGQLGQNSSFLQGMAKFPLSNQLMNSFLNQGTAAGNPLSVTQAAQSVVSSHPPTTLSATTANSNVPHLQPQTAHRVLSDHRDTSQTLASPSNPIANSLASGVQRQSADSQLQPPAASISASTSTVSNLHRRDTKPVPVGSPPMECDSSVPSPPKATPTVITPTNSPKSPLKPIKDEFPSPRSHVPPPTLWNTSPSPRIKEEAADETERKKEKKRKEKEREREKEKAKESEKADRKPAPISTSNPTKEVKQERRVSISEKGSGVQKKRPNEIERLLTDLTETSWVNTVRRVSTGSRRPTEEALLEKKAKKELKKKHKREREEREREKAISTVGSSSTSATTSKPADSTKRRMKQLSDESSSSSSEDEPTKSDVDSEDSDDGRSPPKRTKHSIAAAPIGTAGTSRESANKHKHKHKKRKSRKSDSDGSDSDEESEREKRRKKKANKLAKKEERKSTTTSSSSNKHKKEKEVEPKIDSAEMADDDPLKGQCGLFERCKNPIIDDVNWIQCDLCLQWYHAICVFGSNQIPDDELERYDCGCRDKVTKTHNKKKKSKK